MIDIRMRRGVLILASALLMLLGAGSLALGQPINVWTQYFDAGVSGHDIATNIATDHHNNVIVTGCSNESQSGPFDIVTIKYNPDDGTELWSKRFGTPAQYDTATGVIVDNDDNIYVVGGSRNSSGRFDAVLLKYTSNGDTVFTRRFEDPVGQFLGTSVALDAGGNIYVGALHRVDATATQFYDVALIKYAPSGDTLWSRYQKLRTSTGRYDEMVTMCLDNSGNAILTGPAKDTVPSAIGQDLFTVKYNSYGDTVWTRRFDGGAHWDDYPVSITSDDSGNVYVLSTSDAGYSNYNYSVVKYDRAGGYLFNAIYDYRDNPGCWDIPQAFAVDAAHAIYVMGTSENEDNLDICTVKFLPSGGDTVWSNRYNNGGEEEAADLAVDALGNTYVEGSSEDASGTFDFVTVKYGPDGAPHWAMRWASPGADDAESRQIAIDQLHNIYVCGSTYMSGTAWDYVTLKYSGQDAGVTQILAPVDTIRVNRQIPPRVIVRNYSPMEINCPVRIQIGSLAADANVTLAAYESTLVTFNPRPPWVFTDSGTFTVRAYTMLPGDEEPVNDTARATIVVTFPWLVKPNVPEGAKSKTVKDGGRIAFYPDSSRIYCMKGNNTLEFYMYNCSTQVWATRESVPAALGRKKVKKGSALAYGGNNLIYAFKGNRTMEFWVYDVVAHTWMPRANLPAAIKEGGAMAWVPTNNRMYVLQGSNTQAFWAYHIDGDSWSQRNVVPIGPSNKRPKDGSCIAYDGLSTIYALKGKTSEFFKYDVNSDSWTALKPLPLIGSLGKKKKTGSGSSMAFANGLVFCFKGNNTNEYWAFNPALDSWSESDSMLSGVSRKRIKGGAALATANKKIYALKGNNTREFYLYNADIPNLFGAPAADNNQTSALAPTIAFSLRVSPNPFRTNALVTYSLPREGNVTLKLYDIKGSRCENLVSGRQHAGVYNLRLNDRRLASGVYFLKARFDDGASERQLTSKILIQK
jgi:N-acetylneuraminic acid mutarotase